MNLFFSSKAVNDLAEWRRIGSLRVGRLARKVEDLWDALEHGRLPTQATPLVHPSRDLFAMTIAGRHRMVFAIDRNTSEIKIENVNVVVFSIRGGYWPDL